MATCLVHHQHQRGLSGTPSAPAGLVANGCLDQHRSCLVCLGLAQHLHRWGLGAPRCLEQSRNTCLTRRQHQRCLGACGCLDQFRPLPCAAGGTWLAQHRHHHGLGAPRCLRQSRLMLVMMGALVLHTIGTSRALVRADASTSLGPCALCLGHLARTGLSPVGPWWAKLPRAV